MAISTNLLLLSLSGSIGDQVTIKNYNGKIVLCKKVGERKKKGSPSQLANEQAFKRANSIAKYIYANPVKREEARLRLNVPHGNPLYRAILKECREKAKVSKS